jgi:hypothetical protein
MSARANDFAKQFALHLGDEIAAVRAALFRCIRCGTRRVFGSADRLSRVAVSMVADDEPFSILCTNA